MKPSQRFSAGEVPAGTYEVFATFDGGPLRPAGQVDVLPGSTVVLRCDAGWRRCE